MNLAVIRPLIYFREKEIRKAQKYSEVAPIPSPCPRDGHTARQEAKELIARLEKENPQIYKNLAAAMRQNSVGDLWPKAKSRQEMKAIYRDYLSPREPS